MSYEFLEEFGKSWRQDAQSHTLDAPRWGQDGRLGPNSSHLGAILAPSREVWGRLLEVFLDMGGSVKSNNSTTILLYFWILGGLGGDVFPSWVEM